MRERCVCDAWKTASEIHRNCKQETMVILTVDSELLSSYNQNQYQPKTFLTSKTRNSSRIPL